MERLISRAEVTTRYKSATIIFDFLSKDSRQSQKGQPVKPKPFNKNQHQINRREMPRIPRTGK